MSNPLNAIMMDRRVTTPINIPRTNRVHTARGLTSLPAGKIVPIAACPLLREDQLRSGRMTYSFEMHETAEILMNGIFVTVRAFLVPFLAFERFDGSMDKLNRCYAGQNPDGDTFFTTEVFNSASPDDIMVYLGLHAKDGKTVNLAYHEAYNQIVNHMLRQRSPKLPLRTTYQKDLAPAFWRHDQMRHLVPDFDQDIIDGEVPLNIVDGQLPVTGIGLSGTVSGVVGQAGVREADGTTDTYGFAKQTSANNLWVRASANDATGIPQVFAELAENGITVSLANIELARKTQAFARMREQYSEHSEEYIIDMLMSGLSIPDQALKQPIPLGERTTIFGMSKRYASDAANLTESVVNGATMLELSVQTPRIATGGIVMVTAEIVPEQLFERQPDPLFYTTAVSQLPDYLRDELDAEKVEIVPCEWIDVDHANPNNTFGYAPLNYKWNHTAPKVGGRFHRPKVDGTFDEDRQRLWSVEVANPVFGEDFYLATNIHTKPFAVTNQDPFEVLVQGDFLVGGNTVFGGALMEASDSYEKVLAKAPTETIDKPLGGGAEV